MASLVAKDTSGIYQSGDNETELPGKRTRSFKTFKKGRERRVAGQIGPIHYKADPFNDSEAFKEIDLDIVATPDKHWDYAVNDNGYQARFWNKRRIQGEEFRCVGRFKRAGKWLDMASVRLFWENAAGDIQLISETLDTGEPEIDNDANTITWGNAFGTGIHFRYNLQPDLFYKTVIIDDAADLPILTIDTDGLKLTVELRIFWHGRAKAGNGFGQGGDEERKNLKTFNYKDEFDRNIWWIQEPRAWHSNDEIDIDWKLIKRDNETSATFSIPATALNNPSVVYPVFMDVAIAEEQVGASGDDALTKYGGIRVYTSTNSSNTVGDSGGGNNRYCSGVRFTTIPLPQGSAIHSGVISFKAATGGGFTIRTKLRAYDADDASDDLSTQAKWDAIFPGALTTATVTWDGLGSWFSGTWYDSLNIASVIQEIVDRPGWASNQNMIFFWDDYDGRSDASALRRFFSYDNAAADAAKLNVSYNVSGQVMIFS
jgi:hypothetical protein